MIHVENLGKRYGERVLFEDVSWHVKKRDRIGLSGPNGSGKTTLLRMLARIQEPDSGQIRMASDTTIGYLPQDGIVHAGRTVYEEVILAFQELLDQEVSPVDRLEGMDGRDVGMVQGREELRLDQDDPFPRGFALSDSWGSQAGQLA